MRQHTVSGKALEMTRSISEAAKKAERDFLVAFKLVGFERQDRVYEYSFNGRIYRAHVESDDCTADLFGGKQRAHRLLRMAELIRYMSSIDADLFDAIEGPFGEVVRHYPILTSYYEAAANKGTFHTWLRWSV